MNLINLASTVHVHEYIDTLREREREGARESTPHSGA